MSDTKRCSLCTRIAAFVDSVPDASIPSGHALNECGYRNEYLCVVHGMERRRTNTSRVKQYNTKKTCNHCGTTWSDNYPNEPDDILWCGDCDRHETSEAMYSLTLTRNERRAIDWVGHRHSNGNDLADLLCQCEQKTSPGYEGELDWNEGEDITFFVPEHIAWQIAENAESEDGLWPCFAKELANKMQAFVDGIV